MSASRCCLSALRLGAFLILLGRSGPAPAEAGAEAELTSLLASENLLQGGERTATEAGDIQVDGLLPLERLVSRRTGRDSSARLELASAESGFVPGVETSARLRLELDAFGRSTPLVLRDVGSWLGVEWQGSGGLQWRFRAFPIDTDYERLGYLHALDWGGTDVERGESIFIEQPGPVPGVELAVRTARAGLFAGLRWASAPPSLESASRLWGVTLGGSLEPWRGLCVDFGLGYFQRAAPALGDRSARSFVEGASLRLMWRHGPVEPELSPEPFRPPSLRADAGSLAAASAPGLALALEGVVLATRLRRFEAPEQSALAGAPAAAIYGSLRGRSLAGHAALLWRSLAFVLRNDPGIVRGESSPVAARELAELAAWLGTSVTALPWRLIPSIELGVLAPAALVTPSSLPGFAQTFIAREARGVVALPVGSGRLPIVAGRVGVRFQASPAMALAGFIDYERDPNRVRFQASALGTIRTFASPDRLQLGVAAQARF